MLQYFIAEQTFTIFIFPINHFLTPSFPVIGLDELKYWLGLVNIGLDQLILVRIS